MINKDRILREIRNNGVYAFNYRMLIEDRPTYVTLKAAMIEEKTGPKLIVGVINIDAQVIRDMEYEKLLRQDTENEDR